MKMENNDTLEMAGFEPQQDSSFVTPTKKSSSIPPGDNNTPRRSRRATKPKMSPEEDATDCTARKMTWDDTECPDTAPSTPKISKSKTTSTPRLFNHPDSDVDTPASPTLEAISSNDSFVIPTSICKIWQVSPRKTPKKTLSGSSSSSPSKNTTPGKDPPNQAGPSPYKSYRPKYLPKNINLVKKKRKERNDFLEKVEQFDAQLIKLPSTFAAPRRVVSHLPANDGDLVGTQTPLFVIFNPDNFFTSYTDHTFETHFDRNIIELFRAMKLNPNAADVEDCRALTLFLTVESDQAFFNTASLYIEGYLVSGKYVLEWNDLKSILVNFGLSKEHCEFDSAAYYGIDPPKSPKICNLKFLFVVVEYSFPFYTKKRLERLVKFLSDCLFDPILQQLQHDIVLLLRQVLKHLLQNGASQEELVAPLNHSHYSWISNRVIIHFLAPDPFIKPLATALAYQTIRGILKVDNCEDNLSLSRIADLLVDIHAVREKTTVKDIYQLIAICESLVAMAPSPFDSETKTFLEKLADFAEHMSLTYTYFENLYFTDTVTRIRTLSTVNNI